MTSTDELLDPLNEVFGLGIGRAANVLNSMLDSHIHLSAPILRLVAVPELVESLASASMVDFSAVQMHYSGSIDGSVELIFDSPEAGKLVDCLIGEETIDEKGLDAIRAGTLCEVGNIVINALLGTLSNVLDLRLTYTVPAYLEGDAERLIADAGVDGSVVVLLAETDFSVERRSIQGKIAVFFSLASFEYLLRALRQYAGDPV